MTDSRHQTSGERTFRVPRSGRWIEVVVVAAFWGAHLALTLVFKFTWSRSAGEGVPAVEVLQSVIVYGAFAATTPLIFWMCRYFRPEGREWFRNILIHAGVAYAVSVLITMLDLWTMRTLVYGEAVPAHYVAKSPFGLTAVMKLITYGFALAAGFAREYFLRYRERLTETTRLEVEAARLTANAAELHAQLAESRLQALRMQLNPHFLFNALNILSSNLERDPRGARRMIARLSELLRYSLDSTGDKEVELRRELAFQDTYLEIQQIRFERALEVRRLVEDEVLEALVPNLILQPLVENAIKHGTATRGEGGVVELRAWREGDMLHLTVDDNGPGLSLQSGNGAPATPGIGIRNTRERLRSLYGDEQRLDLESSAIGGVRAHVVLPFHTRADLHTMTP